MSHDGIALTSPPSGRIPGNLRKNLRSLWLFTAFWNAVSVPLLFIVPRELERRPIAAVAFLFPIVGVGLLIWVVRATVRWRRFGDTWLEAGAAPAPGDVWNGAVHAQLPEPAQGDYVVIVRLTCLHRSVSRSGDGERSVHERIQWREEQAVASSRVAFGPGGAAVPFRFAIPTDAQETTAAGSGEGIMWVVTAEAALPGVDMKDDFDVVVRRAAGPLASTSPSPPAPVTVEELAAAGISVQHAGGGLTFRFAPMRNVSMAAGTAAFAAIWTAAFWFQIYVGFPWVFPAVTGLFDLLLIAIVLDLWLGTTVMVVADEAVRRKHGVLGFGTVRTIAGAEVARIELHIGMQTSGRYGTPYYDVRAVLTSGRKASLADGIRSKRHAEWIAAELRARLL